MSLNEKEQTLADDLSRWWMDLAHEEAEAVVDKAVEYGANSMTELGHEIAKLAGRTVSDADAIELACYFYIKGKLGRWSDSIIAGKRVSDDTIKDIGVYVRMVQRVRTNGGWPGTPLVKPTKFASGGRMVITPDANGQISLSSPVRHVPDDTVSPNFD